MHRAYGFVVLVIFGAGVLAQFDETLLTDEMKSLMDNLHKTCVDQIEIEEAQIDQLKAAVFEEDQKTKCYVKCVMSESGVMDENGDVDIDAIGELLPETIRETVKTTFGGCVSEGDGIDDQCDKAFKILQCTHDASPDNYFFV